MFSTYFYEGHKYEDTGTKKRQKSHFSGASCDIILISRKISPFTKNIRRHDKKWYVKNKNVKHLIMSKIKVSIKSFYMKRNDIKDDI